MLRFKLLAFAGFIVLVFYIVRLFDLQIYQGKFLSQLSLENSLFSVVIEPDRGIIFDRYHQPLTLNQADYWRLTSPQRLFSQEAPVSSDSALSLLATDSAQVLIKPKRFYPVGMPLAHVLGYVGKATADQLSTDSRLRSNAQVGQLGLEKLLDSRLRGQPGFWRYESDALGQKLKVISTTPPIPGDSIATSLDPYLSTLAFYLLGGRQGAVVMLDGQTGEILSLVNSPGFDPNLFTPTSDPAAKKEKSQLISQLFQDSRKVFLNRAISGLYPPGSVFKIVTALAGLQNQAFDADTNVVDEGTIKVGEFSFANWYFSQYGRTEGAISLVKALARSNDIFFYKAAEWTGPTKLAQMAKVMGYGRTRGIEIAGEAGGLVPDPEWKESQKGDKWFLGNTYHFGIGQGDLLVTPLQVAGVMQAVINHGVSCPTHLLTEGKQSCETLPVDEKNLDIVLQGLLGACSPGGTAYPFFPVNQNRDATKPAREQLQAGAVICKTGTAEFGGQEGGKRRTHGWFVIGMDTTELNKTLRAAQNATNTAQLKSSTQFISSATTSATINPKYLDWNAWREHLTQKPLPQELVMAILVESDDNTKYREGSRDSAPVAKAIYDWMKSGNLKVVTPIEGIGD